MDLECQIGLLGKSLIMSEQFDRVTKYCVEIKCLNTHLTGMHELTSDNKIRLHVSCFVSFIYDHSENAQVLCSSEYLLRYFSEAYSCQTHFFTNFAQFFGKNKAIPYWAMELRRTVVHMSHIEPSFALAPLHTDPLSTRASTKRTGFRQTSAFCWCVSTSGVGASVTANHRHDRTNV